MAVVIADHKLTKADITQALEDNYPYIKITADLEQNIVAIGGEYHADAEKVMYEKFNSKNSYLWGGGYDIKLKIVAIDAMINRKPLLDNNSPDILDPVIRKRFREVAEKIATEIESLL
jgi:hypothetical protein